MKTKDINKKSVSRRGFFSLHSTLFTLLLLATAIMTACSPDDYGMGGAQYTADQLKAPDAYTVSINGNRVTLTSKLVGCTPLWITPNGRSQEQQLTLALPFAGEYEVTLGAETRAGAVYGEPYKFTLAQNDFTMLDSPLWFYLADKNYLKGSSFPDEQTLIEGISKKWYPNDKDYGLGCTGPVMYMTPYNPTNQEGTFTPEEEANLTYKPITFGRANWAPNWDPGFQSWLIPEDDPYMDSYMEFSMDAANGCVAKVYRGESGSKGSSTGSNMVGKFNLGLLDKEHPTISFSDCYALHHLGGDDMCSNYTQEVIIAEMTPYYLCLVTKRTNSEGPWYIVWNFVSEEVKQTDGACIPKEEVNLLAKSTPVLPEFDNLTTDIFSVENNGVTYVGNSITYTVNEEIPYDILWWNGAQGVDQWQSVTNGAYNNTWAPMPGDDVLENELVLTKNSDGTYSYTYGENEGSVTISGGKLTFSDEVTFLTVANDFRTIAVKGKTFTILEMNAAEGMTLGVPETKDEKGNITSYIVVNLNTKPIGGGQTGPLVVPLTTDYADHSAIEANKYYRLIFYNMYMDPPQGILKDASNVKVKKNQTLKVSFTLKPGLTWTNAPKCALIDNNMKTTWEPGAFDLDDAVLVNTAGETTVTLTNNTGATVKLSDTALQLSIQLDGYLSGFDPENVPDLIQSMTCVIE